ncbi:hypothetical protein ABGB12_12515 [Actinocorallia sp. B10E7]|uniref:hypothetical protein n=1 Tax=Actinocorallia sp. B10E7 TaxID=3153558 RepID=UPI00325EBD4B
MTDLADDDFLDPETEALIDRIDPRNVDITRTAAGHYVEHHPEATGSTHRQAREQIRELLGDMLADERTLWDVAPGGLLTAGLKGYRLVLVPNGEAVVAYSTLHRFRTWQQVKAGVPSPVEGEKQRRKIQRCVGLLVELARAAGATVQREGDSTTVTVTGPQGSAIVRGSRLTSFRKVYAAGAVLSEHVGLELAGDPDPGAEPATLREGWLILPGSEEDTTLTV